MMLISQSGKGRGNNVLSASFVPGALYPARTLQQPKDASHDPSTPKETELQSSDGPKIHGTGIRFPYLFMTSFCPATSEDRHP